MAKNQLFKIIPGESLCLEVLQCFGLEDMDDSKNFSKKDLEVLCTVKRIYSLKPKLELYYIPCKARTYLNDLSPKNTITILRQILKIFDRAVCSRERYIRGQKFVIYQIIPKNCTQYKPVEICNEDSNYTVSFD